MSDPMAFKISQVPSSVLVALGLYSQSFRILNAVEPSVALSNYYVILFLPPTLEQTEVNWLAAELIRKTKYM